MSRVPNRVNATMKTSPLPVLRFLMLGLLCTGGLPAADKPPVATAVTVVFAHPEKYVDVRENSMDFENERGREEYLPLLQEHLEQRAAKRLRPGEKLSVTFTDIDLAGDFEPWHGVRLQDVRIVKDIYVPRLTFTFVLTDASGQVVSQGERRLIDGAFLMSASAANLGSLRFEKQMLDDWLRREFPTRKP
jgi:hypothetical protein